jgi:regulator of sigma D
MQNAKENSSVEEAKEILTAMLIKKYYDAKTTGKKKYIKLSEEELISFCIKLIQIIEKNSNDLG